MEKRHRNRDRQGAEEITYLITFATYGSHVPGQPGAVPRTRNLYGSPLPDPCVFKERHSVERMIEAPYVLDAPRAEVVLRSIREVSAYRGWSLLAAHVRSNHVHVVVRGSCKPEVMMNAFKAYASRALNAGEFDSPDRHRWARHGSTRYLWDRDSVSAAIDYVVRRQGEPMSVFDGSSAP